MVTLEEVKNYLRIDYNDDDQTILQFMTASRETVADLLGVDEQIPDGGIVDICILYGCAFMNENRENLNAQEMRTNIARLLDDKRKVTF